jgi:hypothetical protein
LGAHGHGLQAALKLWIILFAQLQGVYVPEPAEVELENIIDPLPDFFTGDCASGFQNHFNCEAMQQLRKYSFNMKKQASKELFAVLVSCVEHVRSACLRHASSSRLSLA